MYNKKVVVIGPESTGKSTLCQQLASHYHTTWCPEYARDYLLQKGTDYNYNDLLQIAKGQIKLEEDYAAITQKILFVDTNMYVIKVWSEVIFGQCDAWILNQIVATSCDLYLLCNTDLPWQKDALRQHPNLADRQKHYHIYQDILINQSTPWVVIGGADEQRLQTAIQAVNMLQI